MMNKSNFEFLKGVNDFTYAIACAAENNYPDDPNTTLIKMRMFGEATAKHLGLLLNIPPCENQHDLLRELGKIAFVDDNILSVFHKLRRIGNQAVHEYHNDLDDAQMCLRLGFRLAVWYSAFFSASCASSAARRAWVCASVSCCLPSRMAI